MSPTGFVSKWSFKACTTVYNGVVIVRVPGGVG